MKMGWWRSTGLCTALAALALMASTPDASAQDVDGDCRCVDADGDAIDNCTCFVMPDFVMPDIPDIPQVMAFGPDGAGVWSMRATRPRLGVTVSTDQDDSYDGQGARVTDVMEDGPADEAGIREGDVITSVAGRSLFTPLEDDLEEDLDLDESIPVQRLLAITRDLEPGESVEVEYLRDGSAMTTTVEVQDLAGMWGRWAAEFGPRMEQFRYEFRPRMERFRQELRPQMEQLREQIREQTRDLDLNIEELRELDGMERIVIARSGSAARYGLRLTELTPGLGDYFGTDEGVLVTDVDEDSALGLRPGDVILQVGDREATSPSRVGRILATYDDDESVTFRVLREGADIEVVGRLGG